MPNSWEYVVAYLAVLHAGHIALPLDVIYKPLELGAILSQMKPVLVIADESNRLRLDTQIPVLTLSDLESGSRREKPHLRLPADEQIATVFFTSGTTGRPKAAPYTHANHIWNIEVCSKVWAWDEHDSLLISLRLSHWYGSVMGLSGALYHGNTLYLQDRFDAEGTLAALSAGNISMFTHAPLAYSKLLQAENGDKYDLSKVRLFISGSGPLPPKVWQEFKDRYGAEILEVYGSSETGRIASNLLNERIPGSTGRILPGVEAKIGAKNELLVKSPGVFPGYYKNPQLTDKLKTSDGFWRTGDIAELNGGRLTLKGRMAEIIRKQGYTVSPRDVEWALHTNPAIAEVAVLGLSRPDEPDDELVYFLVTAASEDDIRDFCRQALPSVWRPDRIIMVETIPRTRSGKINIPELRAML
ncbi:MAG: AMP-dependent synthetase and ligase [Candidatus Saccharibacteria bacterium]|nr:AMP-dependent synthetase and ligase [Candidatus Saccharibacteria bacterium]